MRKESAAKQKILDTASELFYGQGYQSTGINEIIEKSGVSKATFYKHFPAKDELCLAYLQDLHQRDMQALKEAIRKLKGPRERFLAVMESLEGWMKDINFKGCGFLNIVPEVLDPQSPIRKEGKLHYEALRALLRDLSQDLIDSDTVRYGRLKASELADDYLMIFTGAIALSEIYHDVWALRYGVKKVKALIG